MEVRKQAIKAMDDADETWTVDDSVLDAQRKVKALAIAKQKIAQQVASALQNADREIAAIHAEEQDIERPGAQADRRADGAAGPGRGARPRSRRPMCEQRPGQIRRPGRGNPPGWMQK